jgi:subtilisin family serine protease
MLERFILCVLIGILPLVSRAQSNPTVGVPKGQYVEGSVWVKLKKAHKDIFNGQGGRMAQKVNARSVHSLVKEQSHFNARVAPRKQQIDISLFYKLEFDQGRGLEEIIKELKTTGYFEAVEPIFKETPLLDPDDPMIGQQYALDLIKARPAWDLVNIDENIIIGVVDTGGDLNHPDLQSNLYIDPSEPIDGVDNNNDGYIDNNRGWDFSGSSLAAIGTPGFIGDNDPSINQGGLFSHGTMVAGCASARTNNGIGIASVGSKVKLLFTKHYADDQAPGGLLL